MTLSPTLILQSLELKSRKFYARACENNSQVPDPRHREAIVAKLNDKSGNRFRREVISAGGRIAKGSRGCRIPSLLKSIYIISLNREHCLTILFIKFI